MKCISLVFFSFILDGEVKGKIAYERDVRQADPLSPFLFLFCSEGFSCLLKKIEAEGQLQGLRFSHPGFLVSHILFVDNSFIFLDATKEECVVLKEVLDMYEAAYGQMVNWKI